MVVMDSKRYTDFLLSLGDLRRSQLRHLGVRVQESLEKDEVNCAIEKRLLTLKNCIYCKSTQIVRWGHSSGLQRFRCKQCRRTFNELTGSPFSKVQKREILGTYAQCMVNGLTLRKAANLCDIALSTSFRWRHKFLQMPERHKSRSLGGIVEADETFFRESYEGKRTIKHRKPRHHGRLEKGQNKLMIPVLILLDRNEHEADFVLESDTREQVYPCIKGRIKSGSVLCTDGSQLYYPLPKKRNYCISGS
jgi:transposase-like protein